MFYKIKTFLIIFALFSVQIVYAVVPTIDVRNNAWSHNTQGIRLMQLKKYSSAIQEFNISIGLMPNTPSMHPVYNNLGIAYMEYAKLFLNGKNKKYFDIYIKLAENSLRHAVYYSPVNLNYYENLVECLALENILPQELEKFKKNKDLYTPVMLAFIYNKMGETAVAQGIANRFANENPDLIIAKNLKNYFK